ncbi:MAG: ABC transporter substrate-binding protein [Acetobacteraceae bacterium]|nr:ABC transporter substrate-binding protein [Acetobacteraceae bacterium]
MARIVAETRPVQSVTLLEPFRALFYAPFYLAEARGAFARQGLEVRFETAGTPDAAAARLLAGEADLAWSGPMRPMLMRSQDPACTLRSFCAVVMKDPFLLAAAAPPPAGGFALAGLRGRRLGLVAEVPTPVWCLDDDLRRAGLDPERDIDRRRGPGMGENAEAVLAGELDIAQLFEPFACRVEDGGGTVWHAQASRGPTAYTAFYATEAMLRDRRDALRGMVRAMAEALDWMRTATPGAIAATIAPRFAEVPSSHRVRAMDRYQRLGIWPATPRFPRDALERLAGAMISSGVMAHMPPFEDCVDTAIEDEALAA